jgi:heme-degrading monooxygenase HmoA
MLAPRRRISSWAVSFSHLRSRLLIKTNSEGLLMFTRIVTLNLKPNRLHAFREALDKEVLPMLRKQNGFKDVFALVGPSGTEIRSISFWETKQNAESYNSATYPSVLKILADLFEETPQVKTYEVSSSTFHKMPTLATT